jgi:NAD+ diphosphatase
MARDGKERMLRCPDCGNTLYPKICPAVIVACYKGDKLLLTKYAGRGIGAYALIAGFAEIGESIEDTVRREVFEETGVRVKNLRFYKSQPCPLSDSLLMGFWCELDGSDEITLDTNELSVAEWVDRPISLTGKLISA